MRNSSKWSKDCFSVRHGSETTGDMNFCCCCSSAIFFPRGVPVASLHRLGSGGGGGDDDESTHETCDEVVEMFCSVCCEAATDLPRK